MIATTCIGIALLMLASEGRLIPDSEEESRHVTASPSSIIVGMTKTLTVNCSIPDCKTSGLAKIISLRLSETSSNKNSVNLASVSSIADSPVLFPACGKATVLGHIDDHEGSFLSVSWDNPTSVNAGTYRCVVQGFDTIGQLVVLEDAVEVSVEEPEPEMVVDNLVQRRSVGQIDALEETVEELVERVEILEAGDASDDNNNVSNELLGRFEISDEFKGHRYYLSKIGVIDNNSAQAVCEWFGGSLAQVDGWGEYLFIQGFLIRQQTNEFSLVAISGTDAEHEGEWIHQPTNENLTLLDWLPGRPLDHKSYPTYDCLFLHRDGPWKMCDYVCQKWGGNMRYLCEIPRSH